MANRLCLSPYRHLGGAAFIAALLFAAPPAFAQQHHARLSADLSDHLNAGSQSIDVIVHGDAATVDALAARYNLTVARHLASGAVLRINAGQLAALQQDEGIDHLSGDVKILSTADAVTNETIGADQVWAGDDGRGAATGRGISVAVIDSGIDTSHNALKNRVIAVQDFTGGDGHDHFGHGTHVAAIIAGQAVRGTQDALGYRGVAPGAMLVNLRVLGDDGSGTASSVIEAIDWAIAHRHELNIRIINLSLGAPVLQPYRDDPLCEAVERAVNAGITVVAAAGNFGKTADGKSVYGGITSPANSPLAIAVGASDTHQTPERSDDTLATFSSKGPTRYDLVLKPDVVAPGVHIVSAESAGSYLSTTYPDHHVTGTGASGYMQLSGTSMAAGVVSGAAALVLDARDGVGPRDLRLVLQATSTFLPSAGVLGGGAGIIDVLAAVQLADTGQLTAVRIGGETVDAGGLLTGGHRIGRLRSLVRKNGMTRASLNMNTIASRESIVWDTKAIVWDTDSIVWDTDSIVWDTDSIVWDTDSIVWDTDSIVWDTDSIVWDTDSIVWDTDSIVWDTATISASEFR
jgi:serine protease AprX